MILGVIEGSEGEVERWNKPLLSGVQCPVAAVALLLRSRQTGYWAKLSRFVTECEFEARIGQLKMGAG